MHDPRSTHLAGVRSIVIKLGTQLLSDPHGTLDAELIGHIAAQVAALRKRGLVVTLVSSGAIGAGLRELKLPRRPADLGKLQAVAAVGQRRLMDVWAQAFAPHELPVAQILLTRQDIENRTRFLNLRNTLASVHELGAIPIINENDTVSTDELIKITFGDNDILAAIVCHALQAHLLVLLSVVDGLLDAKGQSVPLVEHLETVGDLVRAEKSSAGKGGMNSKLDAARMVTQAGDAMVVADGRMPLVLTRLLDGERIGTLFAPAPRRHAARTRWIGSLRPAGSVIVDEGAVQALVEKKKSLLPAGIVRVEGDFERGDVISVKSPDGRTIGRGLSNYSSLIVEGIRGKKTAEVRAILAEGAYDEVIHRNNLVLE